MDLAKKRETRVARRKPNAWQGPDGCVMYSGCGLWKGRLLVFESLPSTNRWMMEHIGDCSDGDVVMAVSQSAGQGRMGRSWFAPANRGLAVTLVLKLLEERSGCHAEAVLMNIGRIAAVSVADCLAGFGIGDVMLKWPNDVIVREKKIAGILAERDSATKTIALGIGLNVNATRHELADAGLGSTAISMLAATGGEFDMETVLDSLIASLGKWIDLAADGGLSRLSDEWDKRDWLAGFSMELIGVDGSAIRGVYRGTDDLGRLLMETDKGGISVFTAGDIIRTCPRGRIHAQ